MCFKIEHTKDELVIREWFAEQDQELQSKLLVIAEAYLSATFGPNISDFFDLWLLCTSLVYGNIFFQILDYKGSKSKVFFVSFTFKSWTSAMIETNLDTVYPQIVPALE